MRLIRKPYEAPTLEVFPLSQALNLLDTLSATSVPSSPEDDWANVPNIGDEWDEI